MNKTVVKEWVKALRSGEYKQGIGRLRSKNDRYCCLGVLTDLYVKKNKLEWVKEENLYSFSNYAFTLPKEVFKWSKLKHDTEAELMNMNDEGERFKKIADYIERNYL